MPAAGVQNDFLSGEMTFDQLGISILAVAFAQG